MKFTDCFIRGEFTSDPIDSTENDYNELYKLIGVITVKYSIFEKTIMEKNLHKGFVTIQYILALLH